MAIDRSATVTEQETKPSLSFLQKPYTYLYIASSDNQNVNTPRRLLNVTEIEASWSPEDVRMQRDDDSGEMKVRSLLGNTRRLRGGDWISSGPAYMTLGVTWIGHGTKQYGLTVAHAFTRYHLPPGSSVWAVNSDEPVPAKGRFASIKIGTVRKLDMATDSAVIEIFPSIKIDPLAVALSGGDDNVVKIELPTPLPTPFANPPEHGLPYGEQVVMYGAARRGMVGVRVQRTGDNIDITSTIWSTQSRANADVALGQSKLSFAGDCGALALDSNGRAWSMHTSISGVPKNNPTTWTSHGADLQSIVNAHAFYFGHVPETNSLNLSSHSYQSSPGSISNGVEDRELNILLDPSFRPAAGRFPLMEFGDETTAGTLVFPICPRSRIPMDISDEDEPGSNGGAKDEKKTSD